MTQREMRLEYVSWWSREIMVLETVAGVRGGEKTGASAWARQVADGAGAAGGLCGAGGRACRGFWVGVCCFCLLRVNKELLLGDARVEKRGSM